MGLGLKDVLPAIGSVASSLVSGVSNGLSGAAQRRYDARAVADERAYNTPAKQVQRLRQAGINPALAMTNGMMSSGNVEQNAGGQSAVQYDFSPIAQGVRDSVDLYQQRRLQDAQVRSMNESSVNQSIRNRWENTRQILELRKLLADERLSTSERKRVSADIERLTKENEWIDKRNSSAIAQQDAQARLADEQAESERVMRDVNRRVAEQGIRLSRSQQSVLAETAKQTREQVVQMRANGASQRALNHFVSLREQQTAKQLGFENSTWYETYRRNAAEQRARTGSLNREHTHATIQFFGIPLGQREYVTDVSTGENVVTPNSVIR